MGTLNQLTLVNQFGEESINQIVSANGLTNVKSALVTFAQLNAAGTGVALPLGFAIPDKHIIKQVYYNVLTTFKDTGTSGDADSSTLSLGANSAVDLKAAVAISDGTNPWDAGIKAGIPINTVATMVKTTAERQCSVTWTAGTGNATALEAGSMVVYVEFVKGE